MKKYIFIALAVVVLAGSSTSTVFAQGIKMEPNWVETKPTSLTERIVPDPVGTYDPGKEVSKPINYPPPNPDAGKAKPINYPPPPPGFQESQPLTTYSPKSPLDQKVSVKNKTSNPDWRQISPPTQLQEGVTYVHGANESVPGCHIQGKLFAPRQEPQVVETNCSNELDISKRIEDARVWALEKAQQVRSFKIPGDCKDQNGKQAKHCYVREF